MNTIHARPSAYTRYRGLKRWNDWLTGRLSPARVVLADCGVLTPNEYRWQVDFPSGVTSQIRIPETLVECSPEQFDRVTDRLEAYGWIKALEMAGRRGLRVSPVRATHPRP